MTSRRPPAGPGAGYGNNRPDRGQGVVTLTADDVKGAASLGSGGTKGPRNILEEHPDLFAGVSRGAQAILKEAALHVRLEKNQPITHHASTPGKSPLNDLWLQDKSPLAVSLYGTGDQPAEKPGRLLGKRVQLPMSSVRSWFGGITEVLTHPGLVVRSAERQTAFRIPALVNLDLAEEDIVKLMTNAGRFFSNLMQTDNRRDITSSRKFHPHNILALPPEEVERLHRLPGATQHRLEQGKVFTPDQGLRLSGPAALLVEGRGWIFDRDRVESFGGSRATLENLQGNVQPLAQLGGGDQEPDSAAFVFSQAGLDPKYKAGAVFVATSDDTVLTSIPVKDNLPLRHQVFDSHAATTASMHEHTDVEVEAAMNPVARIGWRALRASGIIS